MQIGGFSAPNIVAVLEGTGYLTKQDSDTTWYRLMETFDLVAQSMASDTALQPGQPGWVATLQVRLIHSRVRRRLRPHWSAATTAREGLPINQEQLIGTLLSFSINVIKSIQKLGGWLSAADVAAYLHWWRYMGHLLGIDEAHNPCTDEARSRGAIESIVLHLLSPNPRSGEIARHLIQCVSHRAPFWWSPSLHSEAARVLLGDPLADALGLVRSFWARCYIVIFHWVTKWVARFMAPWITHGSWWQRQIRLSFVQLVQRQMAATAPTAKDGHVPHAPLSSAASCPFHPGSMERPQSDPDRSGSSA